MNAFHQLPDETTAKHCNCCCVSVWHLCSKINYSEQLARCRQRVTCKEKELSEAQSSLARNSDSSSGSIINIRYKCHNPTLSYGSSGGETFTPEGHIEHSYSLLWTAVNKKLNLLYKKRHFHTKK